jgi:hypothetical protein
VSNWGCPHLVEDKCERVNHLPCELGMKGCVLFGRFRFFDESKNRPKPLASTPAPKPAAEDEAE